MIIIDQITQSTGTGIGFNVTHSVTSPDSVLVVFFNLSGQTVSDVQFNGVDLKQVALANNGNASASAWYMLNPPVGTYTITAIASGSTNISVTALSLLGVDKKTTNLVSASANGTSAGSTSNATLSITPPSANSLILDSITIWASVASTGSPNAGQTQISNFQDSGDNTMGSSYFYANQESINLSWQMVGQSNTDPWAYVAIALEPAQTASIWSPNINLRSTGDVVKTHGLDANPTTAFSTGFSNAFGYNPSQFFQNSFLHTVGRINGSTQLTNV